MAEPERSGVHITAADSGWPVGTAATAEPDPKKDGEGGPGGLERAVSVANGSITTGAVVTTEPHGTDWNEEEPP